MREKKSKPVSKQHDCCREYHTYGDAPLRIIFVAFLILLFWFVGYVILRMAYLEQSMNQQYGAWAQVSSRVMRLERTIDELRSSAASASMSATTTNQIR